MTASTEYKMKIESRDVDIESLLRSSYFYIPRFQRPYSWEDDNILDFWEDIISSQFDDYFIGPMVVFKKPGQQFGVVDGQQRLTTITILLCVLRDKFQSLDEINLAEGLHQYIERKDRSNNSKYILKTETSFPYFQEHIQKYNDAPDVEVNSYPEEKLLYEAHVRFNQLISEFLNSVDLDDTVLEDKKNQEKIAKLISLRDTILNLKVIFVTLDDEDDAYIIFETLNTRGKDLALTDLVKNHFSKHLRTKGDVDHAKIKWEGILEVIHNSEENISTDNFIYHFWASRYEAVPQKKLFAKLKKAVTKANAKAYLGYFVEDAKLYRSLYETTYGWERNEVKVARSLAAMKMFKLLQPIPATLALTRAYKSGVIKLRLLKEALGFIEKFHFQFTAITSSRSSGGISAMYSSFARRLFACTTSNDAAIEINALKRKLRDRVPSMDEFTVAFRDVIYTNSNSKQKNLVRYILRKISEFNNTKSSQDYDDLTIEHIHPQSKIDDNWPENIVGCLGNLMFLDQEMNELLSEKNFGDKRDLLISKDYSIPEEMTSALDWTVALVKKRNDSLAVIAHSKIWKI